MALLWHPQSAFSAINKAPVVKKTLDFYNTHTGERIVAAYYVNGEYQPRQLGKINHILRDHRTESIHPIDTELLNILFDIQSHLKIRKPFHVISGYRSHATNAMLAKSSSGVAKKSLHTKGMAIDIRLPGLKTKTLRDTCIKLQAGGVGYYPKSNFVHVDIGSVRYW